MLTVLSWALSLVAAVKAAGDWLWIVAKTLTPGKAVAGVAALTTLALAYWANRISRAQLLPILAARQSAEGVIAENIGNGAALNVCFTDSRGRVLRFLGSVASDDRVALPANVEFGLHEKHYLYYQDALRGFVRRRTWHRTLIQTRSFENAKEKRFIAQFEQGVWAVPADVRRATHIETPWEHLQRVSNPWDPRNWFRDSTAVAKRRYRQWLRRYRFWREAELRKRFAEHLEDAILENPPEPERAMWPLDITGSVRCGDAELMVHQQTATWVRGDLICKATLSPIYLGPNKPYGAIHGIFHVPVIVFDRFPPAREERCDAAFEAFRRYYCRYRPNWSPFVYSLRRY